MIHYHKNLDSWLAFSDFFCDNVEKVGGATMVELAPQRWIEDKAILRDVYEMGGTVCGGYPRLLIGLNVNDDIDCFSDIDIFPRSETSYNQLLHYFAHMVRSVNPSDKVLWNAKKNEL